ncbi:MAG: hypothetical protein KGM43_11500 [Planctomycetota bacterium]|nr:hypothetical protein [Planctomycetota bacterium]
MVVAFDGVGHQVTPRGRLESSVGRLEKHVRVWGRLPAAEDAFPSRRGANQRFCVVIPSRFYRITFWM